MGCFAVRTSSCSSIGEAAPPLERFRPRAMGMEGGGKSDVLPVAIGVIGASKPESLIGSGGASPSSKSIRSVGGTFEAGGRRVGLGVSSAALNDKESRRDKSSEGRARTVSNSQLASSSSSLSAAFSLNLVGSGPAATIRPGGVTHSRSSSSSQGKDPATLARVPPF